MAKQVMACDYELLDSGEELKLERFGAKTLVRPSAFCVWQPRLPQSAWKHTDARFVHGEGWKVFGRKFDAWDIALGSAAHQTHPLKLRLRLQTNGQTGLFPEHALYMPELANTVATLAQNGEGPKVLNLFAYTGMATVVALANGGSVTHVDSAKKTIAWARANVEASGLASMPVRYMCDDAVKFLQREIRRGSKYSVIIVDPPNFSRISAKKFWSLDKVLVELVDLCVAALDTRRGALFFTCHNYDFVDLVVSNLLFDRIKRPDLKLGRKLLAIQEVGSPRNLPAGCLVMGSYGIETTAA